MGATSAAGGARGGRLPRENVEVADSDDSEFDSETTWQDV
jgi:hypothetical protein